MAWAGTGVLWTFAGGVPCHASSERRGQGTGFSFVQISDSHIGFEKPANPDANETFNEALTRSRRCPQNPFHYSYRRHHPSRPAPAIRRCRQGHRRVGLDVHYAPGEHDILDAATAKAYMERFGKGARDGGYYSFDHSGVHFISLNNVTDSKRTALAFSARTNWPGSPTT